MIDNTSLDEVSWHPDEWKSQTLNLSVKNLDGHIFLDARKWFKNMDSSKEWRMSKGLMLQVGHWLEVLPLIQELAEKHQNDVVGKT